MELEQMLNAINNQLDTLVQQRKQTMIKLCNYKLQKLLSIPFHIVDYIHDSYGNRQVILYIPSLVFDIIVTEDNHNTLYNICYSDVEHVEFYKDEIDTSTFKLINDVFPHFKEIFIDRLQDWFIL
jgi:hypothetical protein